MKGGGGGGSEQEGGKGSRDPGVVFILKVMGSLRVREKPPPDVRASV